MALETLDGIKAIGGFAVDINKKISYDEAGNGPYIVLAPEANAIAFKIQKGPIKEVGVNGCQVDTLIEAAKLIVDKLDEKYPCNENKMAVRKLNEALHWLMIRKLERQYRGVEGTNNV